MEIVPPTRPSLDPRIAAYLDGGAGNGTAVRANVAAWQRWLLHPRVLQNVTGISTATEVLGIPLAAPIFAAPWSDHGLVDPHAEVATARGLRAAGLGLALSSGSTATLHEVGAVSGPYLQQIYLPANRELIRPFVDAAVAAGATALLLTVDNPAVANEQAFRAGLAELPPRPLVNFPGVDRLQLGTAPDLGPDDIGWLTEISGLPVLAKGVLRGDDARRVLDAGGAGVVVSNHGGRQLAGSLATAAALPEVAESVGGDGLVLVDGGIRTAEDVFRALALGADAVLVGRPFAWALARGGEEGVLALGRQLRHELQIVLAVCGAAGLTDIDADLLRYDPMPPGWFPAAGGEH